MMNKDIVMARRLAEKVCKAGGRVYYVGGFVRDYVMGRENKDVDVEVHGITPAQLEEILDSLGTRTVMGASFGIFGLRHYDLDIAMPRSEKATGRGHKDFEVFVDPFLGPEKAAKRRDFTINALMQDVLTEEILDFFGGIDDLKKGVIRHVNDESFQEDPLRVLRAAQFAARFSFAVAPETIRLCRTMELNALASERIMDELVKGLIKGKDPRIFFDVLRDMHQLNTWFAEIAEMDSAAFERAMNALSKAADLRICAQYPLGLMLSVIACHFEGDQVQEKAKKTKLFLSKITNEVRLKKYVENMVLFSEAPDALYKANADRAAYMKLFDKCIEPGDLSLLAGLSGDGENLKGVLSEMTEAYRTLISRPAVRGEDLIAHGFKPGKQMGELIRYAHELHLEGVEKEEALEKTLAFAKELTRQ